MELRRCVATSASPTASRQDSTPCCVVAGIRRRDFAGTSVSRHICVTERQHVGVEASRRHPVRIAHADRAKIASDLAAFEPLLRTGADHEIVTSTGRGGVVALETSCGCA